MSIKNLDAVFHPRSIVLIGGSRKPNSVGDVLARNLLHGGYDGPVMFVHPDAPSLHSTLAFPSIQALPKPPDLAVIATPPAAIPGLIAQLGSAGARAAVVITAGFGEIGAQGLALQVQALQAAKPHYLRIVGPNCVGVISPPMGVNASFAHLLPKSGPIALLTQSGAMLTAMLDWAHGRGIGFSHLISLGGMADVDTGDMLDYLATEPKAEAILCYLESVTHARKFLSAARRAARVKPVILIKSGRHAEGAKAAASHTGALAGSDEVFDAAFRRAGLLRVQSIEELFDAAATLAHTRRLPGDRVAILTNGGGLGVLSVDQLIDEGGRLAALSPATMEALNKALPATWSHANPVDIIGDAPGSRYRAAMEALLTDGGVDVLLVLNCPVATADSGEAAEAVASAYDAHRQAGHHKPAVFASWMGQAKGRGAQERLSASQIPHYDAPENAVRAMSHLLRFERNQALLMQTPAARPEVPHDRMLAQKIVETTLREGREWLNEVEAKTVLKAYGVPVVETLIAHDAESAAAAATRLGFPAAIKILSPDITHKTDVGGVKLNLRDADAVRDAARVMEQQVRARVPSARIEGFAVQAMAQRPGAHELICGIVEDAVFGPVILFGQGGTAVEVWRDKAIALPPLNPHLAQELIGRTRVSKLLAGYRGRPAANIEAIGDVLLALQDLAADFPQIVELDINPLWADQSGVVALDARIRVAPPKAAGTERFAIRPYPAELAMQCRDGRGAVYTLRPIRPEDAPELQAMVAAGDPQDIRMRFFSALKALPEAMAKRLSQIDYDREMAFLAFDDKGQGAGVVRLSSDPDFARAEYSVIVRSDLKGHGLGRALMNVILDYARSRGIKEVFGDVLAENKRMRALCEKMGFKESFLLGEPGVVEVALSV